MQGSSTISHGSFPKVCGECISIHYFSLNLSFCLKYLICDMKQKYKMGSFIKY